MHRAVTRGEFDIQPVNERLIWVYGNIYGVEQAVFSVYAPTNKKDNAVEVDKFYNTMEKQVQAVRTKYGMTTKIVILDDFNARVGIDGSDNIAEEYNENGEQCANGTFGFRETDDNGAELLTFCVAKQFKVMDSYFERPDRAYGTWACNRSSNKGYNAVSDHVLVSKELWGEVVTCGVYIPGVRWNTDHRMVELDLGPCGDRTAAIDATAGRKRAEEKSVQDKERAARRNFNKHVLWCRLRLDPDQELPCMRDTLERLVATAKAELLHNIEEDKEWDRHTRLNATSILQLLTDALVATAEELFPGGVPANNQMKGRHWNSKNRELKKLITKRGELMQKRMEVQDSGRLAKLDEKVYRKQRQIRENLRRNRDAYWAEVAERQENAYDNKDMKLYYKLIKEAHGPQMTSTTKGRQSLTGQNMKGSAGIGRTTTPVELEARWVEHFTELFNQPGILGEGIDRCLPTQRVSNIKIRTGAFVIAELHAAVRDMNNDRLRCRNGEICRRRAVLRDRVGDV
jgi:hypothetical protein